MFQVPFIVGFAIVPFLMTKIGRRPQFIVGSFVLAIVLTLLGVVEQYKFIPGSFQNRGLFLITAKKTRKFKEYQEHKYIKENNHKTFYTFFFIFINIYTM